MSSEMPRGAREHRGRRPVSVLDTSPVHEGSASSRALHETVDLARAADRLGYHRFWVAEHHGQAATASSAPEILIGQVANATERIRVGAGGIMLPNHAPLRVAEIFRALEVFHPGRIDLGLGRAPGTSVNAAMALRRLQPAPGSDDFPAQVRELLDFADAAFPPAHPYASVPATPADVRLPPVWLLGSSRASAALAGTLGLGFAFAGHLDPQLAPAAVATYRTRFLPSTRLAAPHAILAISVVCAPRADAAARLAASAETQHLAQQAGRSIPLPHPRSASRYLHGPGVEPQRAAFRARQLVGTPRSVSHRAIELLDRTGADELMIAALVPGHAARRHCYELLAEAFALEPGESQ